MKASEKFDSLTQKYKENVVCRGFSYGKASRISNPPNASIIESYERITGTKFDPERTLEFTFSTEGIKRDGNEIVQAGWVLDTFRQNPAALWCHNIQGLPIGRSPHQWLSTTNGKKSLRGLIQFATEDLNPLADQVFRMYQEGFLNAVSISWKPLQWEFIPDEEIENSRYPMSLFGGIRFTRCEALEISGCAVGTDSDALQKRIQSGNIRAEDFVTRRSKEIEVEGVKHGVFYCDGHEVEPETRKVFDMKVEKSLLDKLQALRNDYSICEFVVTDDAFDQKSISQFLNENEKIITTTDNIFRLSEPSNASLLLPLNDNLKVRVDKKEPGTTEDRGAISFSIHGKVAVRDSEWNAKEARNRIAQWATRDEEIDYKMFRKAFGYFDETRGSLTSSYKLIHHDIDDEGRFVSVWRGVNAAGQRIAQRNLDIPEGDWPSIERHFSSEYELHGQKAPWDRTIGRYYMDIHRTLKEKNYSDEKERDSLRTSAVSLAKEVFGEDRIPEQWETRKVQGLNDEDARELTTLIAKEIEDLSVDAEDTEERVTNLIQTINERFAGIFSSEKIFRKAITRVFEIFSVDAVDLKSESEVLRSVEKLTGTKDIMKVASRIESKLSPRQAGRNFDTVWNRILDKLGEDKSSNGNVEKKEEE